MAQTQRATNRGREREAEHARRPTVAVVALFFAGPPELQRAKPRHAEELFFRDRRHGRQVRASLQLLPEHMPDEGVRRSVILRTIALGASTSMDPSPTSLTIGSA